MNLDGAMLAPSNSKTRAHCIIYQKQQEFRSRKHQLKMQNITDNLSREENINMGPILLKGFLVEAQRRQSQPKLGCNIVIISLCLILIGSLASTSATSGKSRPSSSSSSSSRDPDESMGHSRTVDLSDKTPDSAYKMAPQLFGADNIQDYSSEQEDRFSAQQQTAKSNNLSSVQGKRTLYACEEKQLQIECQLGESIQLIRANYGRFSIQICNEHGQLDWKVNCMSSESFQIIANR